MQHAAFEGQNNCVYVCMWYMYVCNVQGGRKPEGCYNSLLLQFPTIPGFLGEGGGGGCIVRLCPDCLYSPAMLLYFKGC